MQRLFLSPPHMTGNEEKYIAEVFKSNYIAPLGEYIDKFESIICDYTKAKYALGVINGTSAIHLALRVLGVNEEDEILVSSFTFIGSVAPVLYQNAKPVFIDSDRSSWNLDPKLLESYLQTCEKRPKALIVTHLYGQVADIALIATICKKYNVYLIEDAAESLGATVNGKHSGTFGDFGVYSFNGNKILTTSGAGMLVSNNKAYIDKAKFYATQAREDEIYYEHLEVGYNYRLSNVLAAIGVAQMEVIEERVEKKRQVFDWYVDALSGLDIEFMPELQGCRGNRWLTTLLFKSSEDASSVMKALSEVNCESRPLWKPMHVQKLFSKSTSLTNGTSETLFDTGLCLPSGTQMNKSDVEFVCSVIKKILIK
jgi:UDP-N-acetylbacillosamine transaminase